MDLENIFEMPFLSKGDVEEEIRRISKESTKDLIKLDHAIDRMDQRGITDRQVLNTLRLGERISDITWDTKKERGWKCAFRKSTAGSLITVATKLVKRERTTCLIVTTYKKEDT